MKIQRKTYLIFSFLFLISCQSNPFNKDVTEKEWSAEANDWTVESVDAQDINVRDSEHYLNVFESIDIEIPDDENKVMQKNLYTLKQKCNEGDIRLAVLYTDENALGSYLFLEDNEEPIRMMDRQDFIDKYCD
ncbi:hypothetical protein [Halobacillus litoralis]|uniref:hypothetical protein n=1 Tax=Halobacillus litoralis TaxID=45668 RepID=UPI001CFE29CC|nr:hypothetical protein [Halobacillus litoralis]